VTPGREEPEKPTRDGWDPATNVFTSREGRFRIQFPERPAVEGKRAYCNKDGHQLSVTYFEIDESKWRTKTPDQLLDEIQATQVKTWGAWGKPSDPIRIKRGDHAGRVLLFLPDQLDGLVLGAGGVTTKLPQGATVGIYVVNRRAYIVAAASRPFFAGDGKATTGRLHVLFQKSLEFMK
jgi:hypothetical protein